MAWYVASIPFWVSGAVFCKAALQIATTPTYKNDEKAYHRKLSECGIAMLFGLPLVTIAAWMCS